MPGSGTSLIQMTYSPGSRDLCCLPHLPWAPTCAIMALGCIEKPVGEKKKKRNEKTGNRVEVQLLLSDGMGQHLLPVPESKSQTCEDIYYKSFMSLKNESFWDPTN